MLFRHGRMARCVTGTVLFGAACCAKENRDVRTISDTPYRVAVVARLYCIGLIQPRDSFGLSSL
jgi:hypothetical protein